MPKVNSKTSEDGSPAKRSKLLYILVSVLVLLQLWQMYKFHAQGEIIESVGENRDQMIAELGQAQEYLNQFALDLNEVRSFLLLPTQDYDFSQLGSGSGEGGSDDSVQNAEDLTVSVYGFVDELGSYQENRLLYEGNLSAIQTDLNDASWFSEEGITLSLSAVDPSLPSPLQVFFYAEDLNLLSLELSMDGHFSATTYKGPLEFTDASDEEKVWTELQDFLKGEWGTLLSQAQIAMASRDQLLNEVLYSEAFSNLLLNKGVSLGNEYTEQDAYSFDLLSSDQQKLATISVMKKDGSWVLTVGETEQAFESKSVDSVLMEGVSSLDARTMQQKKVDQSRADLELLFEDPAFTATLDQYDFSLGEMYETDIYFAYPILDPSGNPLRIFGIDKGTGDLVVLTPGLDTTETIGQATQTLADFGKKKTIQC